MGRHTIPEYCVIRDTREKPGHGWDFDVQADSVKPPRCIGTIIETLDTGDYSIKGYEDLVRIERKNSFSELWVNYGHRKTFEAEMDRLAKFKYKYVLIESSLEKDHFNLSPPQFRIGVPGKALIRWLISISLKYNVHIIPVGSCGKQFCRSIFCEIIRFEKDRWLTK